MPSITYKALACDPPDPTPEPTPEPTPTTTPTPTPTPPPNPDYNAEPTPHVVLLVDFDGWTVDLADLGGVINLPFRAGYSSITAYDIACAIHSHFHWDDGSETIERNDFDHSLLRDEYFCDDWIAQQIPGGGVEPLIHANGGWAGCFDGGYGFDQPGATGIAMRDDGFNYDPYDGGTNVTSGIDDGTVRAGGTANIIGLKIKAEGEDIPDENFLVPQDRTRTFTADLNPQPAGGVIDYTWTISDNMAFVEGEVEIPGPTLSGSGLESVIIIMKTPGDGQVECSARFYKLPNLAPSDPLNEILSISKSANVRVYNVKIIIPEPRPEPYPDPHFVFSSSLNVEVIGTTGLSDLDDQLTWSIESIGDSVKTADPESETGASVVYQFMGMPSSNSAFGKKMITLTAPNLPEPNTDTREIEVFFSMKGIENGNTSDALDPQDFPDPFPNWFWFYRDGCVAPSFTQDIGFYDVDNSCHGKYLVDSHQIVLTSAAPDERTSDSFNIPNGNNVLICVDAEGVDSVEQVAAHENVHKRLYETAGEDSDHDFIPDELETGNSYLGTDPTRCDTWGFQRSENPQLRDQELWAYVYGVLEASKPADWANDWADSLGKNWWELVP